MTTFKTAEAIAAALLAADATVSTAVGVPVPVSGYVVGNDHATFTNPAFSDIVEWVRANKGRSDFLGSWKENGVTHLDTVEILPEAFVAIAKGITQKQLAIYDLGKGETLYL